MHRPPTDPYDPLRRELAALGYLSGEIQRAIDYYEREGTFRGFDQLEALDQIHAELILQEGWPMSTVDGRRHKA